MILPNPRTKAQWWKIFPKPRARKEDKIDEDVTVPPKIKPIMLKYKDNYNMVLKGLNRMYPNSTNKLTGKYIKIMASTTDEHREITNLLKSKGEEFYSVPALADRPLKVVIKGLPNLQQRRRLKQTYWNKASQ
ncbi:hypothetical protein TNCV_1526961 [Trichonephila clavipes]|nr:hypothetical protein TNCV_1526961 [Trichonephila clavipes]